MPNQMWLDGLYMAGPIAVQYGKTFGEPDYFDMMTYQAILMESHTKDPITGLFYHGWDETKTAEWADPVTGLAPEFWGRALGWYPVALLARASETTRTISPVLRSRTICTAQARLFSCVWR
ncbi:glycoside hydrolase family 88 protein [Paenibacillus roseipurpureus]|uniref:Glycoside hydrolase family 88 protein n=1 Tax=Paenibacillus roseopurpureus TaxID=2918901 RepID=A0AA96RJN3_9BACL|nr:glycoside hydrolase family 88 protein [Paenibacillus sp. MBLB1832]WNR45558.1 glycoside hydrolase family 88 protein [Paenibacillus sp. MBLB1832]